MRLPLVLLAFVLLILVGCTDDPAPRGSAQDQSASAAARLQTSREAADAAAVAASASSGRAAELEHQAVADPTPAKIAAAADARVKAAADQAVAAALGRVSVQAQADAERAAVLARQERAADAAAADARRREAFCFWVGLIGVALGGALGLALGYLVSPRCGALVGGATAALGLLVVAYGQTVTWLPMALGAAVVSGLVLWFLAHRSELIGHRNEQQISAALSKTVDAVEGRANLTAQEAKAALSQLIGRTGAEDRFARLRAGWSAAQAPSPNLDQVLDELRSQHAAEEASRQLGLATTATVVAPAAGTPPTVTG